MEYRKFAFGNQAWEESARDGTDPGSVWTTWSTPGCYSLVHFQSQVFAVLYRSTAGHMQTSLGVNPCHITRTSCVYIHGILGLFHILLPATLL